MAIIDCTLYNGEQELWDLRYNILKQYVDEFVVCEATQTFSGQPKQLLFDYKKYSKAKYYIISENQFLRYYRLAVSSPNTSYGKGASHWVREFAIKEAIKDSLTHLKDNDTVFVSDTDEIWNPIEGYQTNTPFKLMQRVYTYYLNNLSSEKWWGTLVTPYKFIKNGCLNHLRTNSEKDLSSYKGWHFTSLAPYLKQKLKDSYTDEDYATEQILSNLDKNIKENKDFLGRDFTYVKDESKWPNYLRRNRDKYKHLML